MPALDDYCDATRPGVPSILNQLLNSAHKDYNKRKADGTLRFPVTDTYKEFDDAILEQKPLNWTVNDAKTAYFGPEISPEIRIPTAVGATTTSFIATVGAPAPGSYKLMEIVCQHDERAQASDLKGTLGLPIRPPPVPTIGPVSTLFRWYARRDIWLGKESPDDLAPKPADSLFDTARRPVNTEDDPVMSFYELVSLLEDFEIIPQKMRRGDLQKLYHLACTAPKHGHLVPNPHPKELRYPDFCRLLVRLALVLNGSWPLSESYPRDEDKLKAFGDKLLITASETGTLLRHLRDLRVKSSEKGKMRKECRMDYVHTPSAIEAVKATPKSSKTGYAETWDPTSAAEVPQHLIDRLLKHDSDDLEGVKFPKWKGFADTKLDMGIVHQGDTMEHRVVIRNRTKRQLQIEVNIEGAPWITATFSEAPLAASAPRVIALAAHYEKLGELTGGGVEILAREIHLGGVGPVERVWVPIYARVKPPRPITARVNTRSAAAISPDDDAADRWKSTLTAASSQTSFK